MKSLAESQSEDSQTVHRLKQINPMRFDASLILKSVFCRLCPVIDEQRMYPAKQHRLYGKSLQRLKILRWKLSDWTFLRLKTFEAVETRASSHQCIIAPVHLASITLCDSQVEVALAVCPHGLCTHCATCNLLRFNVRFNVRSNSVHDADFELLKTLKTCPYLIRSSPDQPVTARPHDTRVS